MPLQGEVRESAVRWVRDQLAQIDAAGSTDAVDIMGRPVVVFTIRGRRSGMLLRVPLMRVEHAGSYAAVASNGGAATHPAWTYSLRADPQIDVQDGRDRRDVVARELAESGAEREEWWARCVEAFPPYADYVVSAAEAGRVIPVFVCTPV